MAVRRVLHELIHVKHIVQVHKDCVPGYRAHNFLANDQLHVYHKIKYWIIPLLGVIFEFLTKKP